jgi:hypothetical protein
MTPELRQAEVNLVPHISRSMVYAVPVGAADAGDLKSYLFSAPELSSRVARRCERIAEKRPFLVHRHRPGLNLPRFRSKAAR